MIRASCRKKASGKNRFYNNENLGDKIN